MARTIVSLSEYLPVPTSRREWNVRPPMANGVSRRVSTAVAIGSPSSHEMHQLDRVPWGDPYVAQREPPHDRAVMLDDHRARVELERGEQLEQGRPPRHRAALPVQRDVDRIVHRVNYHTMLRAAPRANRARTCRSTSPSRGGARAPDRDSRRRAGPHWRWRRARRRGGR